MLAAMDSSERELQQYLFDLQGYPANGRVAVLRVRVRCACDSGASLCTRGAEPFGCPLPAEAG
jgi:hypothetical protein